MPVKFDRENINFDAHYNWTKSKEPPTDVWGLGLIMYFIYFSMFCVLVYTHIRHDRVFQDRYNFAQIAMEHHKQASNKMASGNFTPQSQSKSECDLLFGRKGE